MTTYRCFLLSGERIQSVQVLDCADDAEVGVKAAALLKGKPEHQGAEIWQAGRFVARISSPTREPE